MSQDTERYSVEVYVRAFEPVRDEHREAVDRLQRFADEGAIEGFTVRTWPSKVRLSDRSIATDVVDAYERFDAWASEHGVTISPPFDVRETGFDLLGERDQALILPGMFLTVSVGEDLVGLYPCRVDGRRISIADCLDAIESGSTLPP